MPTEKQKAVIPRILENHGNISKSMREVGYEPSTADTPSNLTESKGYQQLMNPIVLKLEEKRRVVIDALTDDKINAEKAKDLTDMMDKLTKNIQLLGGGATENVNYNWNNYEGGKK